MDAENTIRLGRALADQVETVFADTPTAACIYALALVTASAIADSQHRDVDKTMKLMRSIVELEVSEMDADNALMAQ